MAVSRLISRPVLAAAVCALGLSAAQAQAPTDNVFEGARLGFVGRMVADLDKSVAFYKAIGFSQDPLANPGWRKDEVSEHLYGVKGFQTRMAKMYVVDSDSGQHFVVYLRELKGLKRADASHHTPWDPGVSHFGIIVADANKTWAELQASGQLRARSWDNKLIALPGQAKGTLAYMTDPDGLDIEFIDQRPATPAADGKPGRPASLPGVTHVGIVVLDSDKARAFYGDTLGGKLVDREPPWLKGDLYDSAVGAHGNILRFFNLSFPQEIAPALRMNFELVEFQNRKKPVEPVKITDIGVGYVGYQVHGLDAWLAKVKAAGATVVSDGIVTMRTGTREVMVRDPDVGGFVELFEEPAVRAK
jgi:catechol 2,3-dioxygenase-like lactoylglutathione lyase family enzyme